MDCVGQLLIHIAAHLMAGQAEAFGVGELHAGIETAPEYDPADESAKGEEAETKRAGRRARYGPEVADYGTETRHATSSAARRGTCSGPRAARRSVGRGRRCRSSDEV